MNDINECKPVPYSITAMINKNDSVTIQEYEKRGNRFYDVTTRINGVVKFIGRYYKEFRCLQASLKNSVRISPEIHDIFQISLLCFCCIVINV